jgi:hypothetical protein
MHAVIPIPVAHIPHLHHIPLCSTALVITLDLALLLGDFCLCSRPFEVLFPLGVRTLTARTAVRAESGEIENAQLAANVLLGAFGTERTEALVVVRAGWELGLRVDVEVQALLAVGAVAVAGKEVALRHFAEVVLVKEFAVLALFAEATQPMFADEGGGAAIA